MTRRRTAGEGTLRQRPDGRWEFRATIGFDAKGRQRRRSYYGATAAEAVERARSAPSIADPSRITVAQFLARWIRYREAPPGGEPLKPSTALSYREIIRRHVNPRLGGIQLARLRPLHVEDLLAELAGTGRAERTVRNVRNVLSGALRQAVAWGILRESPVVPTPRRRRKRAEPPKAWGAPDVVRFLEAARGHRLYAIFYLALTTGAREGELVALQRQDFNLGAGTLWIRRSISYIPKKGLIEVAPKTERSRRLLHLPPDAVAVLAEHLNLVERERKDAAELWTRNNLLFPSTVGTPLAPRNLLRTFDTLQTRAAVPRITMHGLRHTYASLALRSGLPLRDLSDRLGHYDPSFTFSVYCHVLPDAPTAGRSVAELTAQAIPEDKAGVN